MQDCKRRMRFLRTVRPDLGEDIPYSEVGFLMERAFMGEGGLVICEGRGPGRRGAHTKYHNRTGYALALDGNFEDHAIDLDPWIPQLSRFWSWAKYERPIPNLGTVTPHDADVWGHQQSGASTACPGMFLMSKLPQVTIDRLEDDDMTFIGVATEKDKEPFVSYMLYVDGDGSLTRRVTPDKETREALHAAGFRLREMTREQLEQYKE